MKNEAEKDIILFEFLTTKREFAKKWHLKKIENNDFVTEILKKASKSNTGQRGEPDFIYYNEDKKLLILIENKDSIKNHQSANRNNPIHYAVDGVWHYLSFFKKERLRAEYQKYFDDWKFIGLAISGNIESEYNHLISTFILKNPNAKIEDINNNNILNEEEYLSLFQNINIEEIVSKISQSSNYINQILRNMNSQKRPIVLSSLMICLFEKEGLQNDLKGNYRNYTPQTIINNIPTTIELILKNEGIPSDKIKILKDEFTNAITNDLDLAQKNHLRDILRELEENVIPLFKTNTNYDIIGKFYEEFLKYAGTTNVKKGIVLTPRHITELFTDLIDIKTNDVIFDPACGTGAFLIAGMNKILALIEASHLPNKQELKNKVKEEQLIGFEKNPTMFSLSISNMLFRGDGKSQIHQIDFFEEEKINSILKSKNPTIGFINPPYGGQDNKKNPTKKEIQFLQNLLDRCSRYVVMIAPLSTYFKEEVIRNNILAKHTLKAVINMPSDLFQPNASTHTAISVFETNLPHNNKEVLFYDLKEDGFVLVKHKGRTDVLNKWYNKKKLLLEELEPPYQSAKENYHFVKKTIKENDEWIFQAHSKIDYSTLNERDFLKPIKEYMIFKIKKDLNLLDKNLNEFEVLEILSNSGIDGEGFFKNE